MRIAMGSVGAPSAFYVAWQWRDEWVEKRVAVVVPGRIVRGAWQRPGPLRRILARERIRTIVTLSAINDDDPKYVDQARVVRETGVAWLFVPIRGSYATVEQMAEAADLLADPRLQPIFYHCVAGHHRSSQVQAAYRIRHQGWSAGRAWGEVAALPWAKPVADSEDRRLIEAFASAHLLRKDSDASVSIPPAPDLGRPPAPGRDAGRGGPRGVDVPDHG
jgi:protein tyrosine phosphatase (PTP) superfamily phosphohydrolase (DUF442 family)